MYYRAVNTGHIFGEDEANMIRHAFGDDKFKLDVEEGRIEIMINPPTVIDLLRNGNHYLAVQRYVEIHSTESKAVSFRYADKMVTRIRKDMERIRSEHINKK